MFTSGSPHEREAMTQLGSDCRVAYYDEHGLVRCVVGLVPSTSITFGPWTSAIRLETLGDLIHGTCKQSVSVVTTPRPRESALQA